MAPVKDCHVQIQGTGLLDGLEEQLASVHDLQTKLILLVGPERVSKSRLLESMAVKMSTKTLCLGRELAQRLAPLPHQRRTFAVGDILRELANSQIEPRIPLLVDNIEVLFERSLNISPLDQLKQLAHARPVIAAWPGELHADRLVYADITHPEHQDYSRQGVVVFNVFA